MSQLRNLRVVSIVAAGPDSVSSFCAFSIRKAGDAEATGSRVLEGNTALMME
jgi:hypothetical protein